MALEKYIYIVKLKRKWFLREKAFRIMQELKFTQLLSIQWERICMQLFLFNRFGLYFSTQNIYILHKNGIYWFIISYRSLLSSGKCCLLYFILNSLLTLWLLWTFLEWDISPIDAFYLLSACFFPSSKILNSAYQTWFNELRVGVFPSAITQYPVHISLLLSWNHHPSRPGCYSSMCESPSTWLDPLYVPYANKQINRGFTMSRWPRHSQC